MRERAFRVLHPMWFIPIRFLLRKGILHVRFIPLKVSFAES